MLWLSGKPKDKVLELHLSSLGLRNLALVDVLGYNLLSPGASLLHDLSIGSSSRSSSKVASQVCAALESVFATRMADSEGWIQAL